MNIWSIFGWYMVYTYVFVFFNGFYGLYIHGYYMDNIWTIYGKYIVYVWVIYGYGWYTSGDD